MRARFFPIFFIFIFIFPLASFAQIELNPGEITFNLVPICVVTTKDGRPIQFSGNISYLAIYWEAYYCGELSERGIGVTCFFNNQNCSGIFSQGRKGCSIINPNYTTLTSIQNVTCWFYDPDPEKTELTKGSLNESFIPIKFTLSISNYSATIGEEVNLPFQVSNFGLFSEKYNISFYTKSPAVYLISPNFSVELHGDYFEPHLWNRTGPDARSFSIKFVVLDANVEGKSLCVNMSSTLNPSISLERCVEIKADFKSMDEFEFSKFLILTILATIFIFKMKNKSRVCSLTVRS